MRRLPFVWVFGRSFWAVSLYGANVYVEQVMPALEGEEDEEDEGAEGREAPLRDCCTGKFVLYVDHDSDEDVQLALRVELARGVAASDALVTRVAAAVRRTLLRVSSEYAGYVPGDRQLPKVTLHAWGDPQWFPTGVKHQYVLRP